MFVSAIGKLPGTKQDPHQTSFGAVHVDNVTAEINIHPADSVNQFHEHMVAGLVGLEEYINALNLTISRESVGRYSASDLQHPDALEAGCDPDVNAYTKMWNCVPQLQETPFRCAGGHIHIGADLNNNDMDLLAKALDLFIAIPSLSTDNPMRRRLYGGAGAFRPKPYGMEYRTPSNHWIFEMSTRHWVYQQVERALSEFRRLTVPDNVEQVINQHDITQVQYYMEEFGLAEYPNVTTLHS
jgi:hypothetical protein